MSCVAKFGQPGIIQTRADIMMLRKTLDAYCTPRAKPVETPSTEFVTDEVEAAIWRNPRPVFPLIRTGIIICPLRILLCTSRKKHHCIQIYTSKCGSISVSDNFFFFSFFKSSYHSHFPVVRKQYALKCCD